MGMGQKAKKGSNKYQKPSLLLRMRAATHRSLQDITLSDPLAGLHELNNVDELLGRHDGEGGDGEDPRNGAVHFVGSA